MARQEPEEEPSRAAGACVLVVLVGGVAAALFAINEAVGILATVAAAWVALWRTARRKGTDLPLPSPTVAPSLGDVYARETTRVREVRMGPGEGMTIFPEIEDVTAEEVNDR